MRDAPYRSAGMEDAPRPLVLWPLFAKRIAGLGLVLATAPLLLFLFLWSRVVTITCEPLPEGAWGCEVREEAIASIAARREVLRDVTEVHLAGETRRSRGDAWIEVVTRSGVVRLTRGFAGAKDQQLQVARELDRRLTRRGERFAGRYGARWTAVFVPALGISVGALIVGLIALRVVLRVDPRHRLLVVDRRHLPLPASRMSVELAHVERLEVGGDARGRATVDLRLRTGERVPLFRALEPEIELERARQWLEAARG